MDLNLLQVFDAVHASGSVSRAAAQLGLSQPAVSHALRRLRTLFKDPLFVRVPGGVAPTAKADRLAGVVRQALSALDIAIRENDAFEPATSDRVFRVHMSDVGEVMWLPRLMEALQKRAPHLRIEVRQLDAAAIMPALESGAIDLALGYLPQLGAARHQVLLREHYVVLVRSGHPLARRRVTGAALRQTHFIHVRSHEATLDILRRLDLARNVRLSIPHFMVIPGTLACTNLAVLIPYRLANVFVADGNCRIVKPSIDAATLDVAVHWYWRFEADAGNRWLRELTFALFCEVRR
jgi:DNA-binding transcriptional LysR family regulator